MIITIEHEGTVWKGHAAVTDAEGDTLWDFRRVGASSGVMGFFTTSLDGAQQAIAMAQNIDNVVQPSGDRT